MLDPDLVNLYVGPERKHYKLHKALLCSRVPYFSKMFNQHNGFGFIESHKNAAEFPEDDPGSFDQLQYWVYYHTLRPLLAYQRLSSTEPTPFNWNPSKFYALADKLCIPVLKDQIITCWHSHYRRTNTSPQLPDIREILDLTPPDSPPRRHASGIFSSLHYKSVDGNGGRNRDEGYEKCYSELQDLYPELRSTNIEVHGCCWAFGYSCMDSYCAYHVHRNDEVNKCFESRRFRLISHGGRMPFIQEKPFLSAIFVG
jgi:hypothetical protein